MTPLADEEADRGAGAWMVKDDDATFLVQLVGSQDRARLCVIVWRPGGETVSEARAHVILEHFGGLSVFVRDPDRASECETAGLGFMRAIPGDSWGGWLFNWVVRAVSAHGALLAWWKWHGPSPVLMIRRPCAPCPSLCRSSTSRSSAGVKRPATPSTRA